MRIDRGRVSLPPQREPDGAASATTVQGAASDAAPTSPAAGSAPAPAAAVASLGGGLSPVRLEVELAAAAAALERVRAAGAPADLPALIGTYEDLGHSVSRAQAALISALDALDPLTGGGVAKPPEPFREVRSRAMQLLRDLGVTFADLEPSFATLVHGGGGWPNRPVEVAPDRGDGVPLRHYENTYKKGRPLTPDEQRIEYQKRVDRFMAAGGSFSDLYELGPDTLHTLEHRVRLDYVMLTSGKVRLGTTEGEAKPGHTLLAGGGPAFSDEPMLLAGEMWALRDSAGDLEVLLVANNSGHFKPRYEDLVNALPHLAEAGVPPEKVVLFGGPNNLPAIFSEIEEKHGLGGLAARLPPSPSTLLESWASHPGLAPWATRG